MSKPTVITFVNWPDNRLVPTIKRMERATTDVYANGDREGQAGALRKQRRDDLRSFLNGAKS